MPQRKKRPPNAEMMIAQCNNTEGMGVLNLLFTCLLLVSFVTLSFEALAGEPVGWNDLGLYGGQINTIAIDPVDPNTMFAGTWNGDGLFKSTDGGATWQSVEGFRNEDIQSISFDPGNRRVIWIAEWSNVYKSVDGGLTWRSWFISDRYFTSLAIDTLNSNTVYAGTTGLDGSDDDAKIYKTIDGGETWEATALAADHTVVGIAVDPKDSNEIWAVTHADFPSEGSIYRSLDGGANWTKIDGGTEEGWEEGWFDEVAISPHDSNIVMVGGEKGLEITKDGGNTWSLIFIEENTCRALAFDPQNANVLYANLGYDLVKSTDSGESWPYHSISPLNLLFLMVHPQNSQVLYGGDVRLGVYKSIDGGQNWQPVNQGIKANHVEASTISPSGKILVGSHAGVFSKIGQQSWTWLDSNKTYSVAFNPEDESTIYAGLAWELAKSTDSGQTWSYLDITSEFTDPHRVSSIFLDPQNSNTLYLGVFYSAGDFGELYRSTDGGESITKMAHVSTPVNAVKVSPTNSRIIYMGSGMFFAPVTTGGVNRTTNGGLDWELTLSDVVVNTLAIDSQNPWTIYAGCGGSDGTYSGIFKSLNRGRTWEKRDFGLPDNAAIVDLEIDRADSDIMYAATYRDGIYISHDGGDYWTLLGLSDYELSDILTSDPGLLSTRVRKASESTILPSSDVYAGSGSGMLEYSGSGTGVIAGMLTDGNTGAGITEGTLSTDTGGIALSYEGKYIMIAPAGQCTVSAAMEGYQAFSQPGVTVTSGEDVTVNVTLMPLSAPNMRSITTNLTNNPPAAGSTVQITFTSATQSNVEYYWYWNTVPFTSWNELAAWSTNNSVMNWTPASDNRYVVLAWVRDSATSPTNHMIGLTFETQGYSGGNPIQITGMTSTMSDPHPSGTPVTFNTAAVGGSGQSYYRYFYRLGASGPDWIPLGPWNTSGNGTWTPSANGLYTVAVHVSNDNTVENNPLVQAGMTCTIGE